MIIYNNRLKRQLIGKSSMAKEKLCSLIKKGLLKDDKKRFKQLVGEPCFFCKKCGRLAAEGKNLCKPEKL